MKYLVKLKKWINKDDGKHYQIGNKDLNSIELLGYFLLILSFLAYVLHDKAELGHISISVVLFASAVTVIGYGMKSETKNKEKQNT